MNEIDTMLENKEAQKGEEKALSCKITIFHVISELKAEVAVEKTDTLGKIAQEHGPAIGLHKDNKLLFYNYKANPKRSTSDTTMTLAEFGMEAGDFLGISDEGSVAAPEPV